MTRNPPPQQQTATVDELVAAFEALTEPEKLRLARRADQLHWGTEYAEGEELMNEAMRRALTASARAGLEDEEDLDAGAEGDGSRRRQTQKGRAWAKNVDFVAFLMMTMKGLTSDSRRSTSQKVAVRMEAIVGDEGEEIPELTKAKLHHPPVDQALIEREEAEERDRRIDEDVSMIEKYFAQDEEVLGILLGEREGWSAEKIREEFKMTKLSYDTARTRMRRGLDKLMPGRRRK